MVVWFIVMALLGGSAILCNPEILKAVSTWYGFALFVHTHRTAFVALRSAALPRPTREAAYAARG